MKSETDIEWRRKAADQPVVWTGDLSDDCTALWAGFMLRAEEMDRNDWWWCVYDMEDSDKVQVASSNDEQRSCCSGEIARTRAEIAARIWLGL